MPKEINLFEQDLFSERPVAIKSSTPTLPSVEREAPSANSVIDLSSAEENLSSVLQKLQEKQEQQQQYQEARFKVKRVIEALLFAVHEPLSFQKIREVTESIYPFKPKVIHELIEELAREYRSQQRAFQLEEIGQGYILRTRKDYGPYIEQIYRNKRGEKLSQAATEVLAIVAYRQPITRPQVDAIRGVDSSGIIQSLLERELIEPLGKLEAPGRPALYGVTKEFLLHYGLKDLKELPKAGTVQVKPGAAMPVLHGPPPPTVTT